MKTNAKPSEERKSRRIKSLLWAELRPEGPFPKSRPRKSGFKAGIAYEKKVGRYLKSQLAKGKLQGELVSFQWILFSDQNGRGWAQTDFFLLPRADAPPTTPILLIEAKLTQTESAIAQLISLYLPLLRKIYNKPIVCLQVCKRLRYIPPKFVESPQEVLQHPGPGMFTWHYPAL